MPHYQIGYSTHRDGDQRVTCILIERRPWWVAAVEQAAFALCWATRHRTCGMLCGRACDLAMRHEDRFEIPAPAERVAAFSRWRGWGQPHFADVADDFTRT